LDVAVAVAVQAAGEEAGKRRCTCAVGRRWRDADQR